MKTATTDLLKKELLLVELPRVCDYKLTDEMIFIMDKERSTIHRFKGSYTLLGKPDEIKEEDVADLVEKTFTFYKDYNSTNRQFNFALWYFNSAIESVIYWENPHGKSYPTLSDNENKWIEDVERKRAYIEAQSRTFDRTRTLIFVKN